MTISLYARLFALSGLLLSGCVPGQIVTVTIYDRPDAFVRLETDRTIDKDSGHTHPVDLTPEHMAALLGGIVFEEPWAKLPLYDDMSQLRHHPAFTEPEIVLFAPLLASALGKATPEELVTFYRSTTHSGTQRHVTSGGLYVQGEDLHIVLANYRSPAHYSADIGVADTLDDRLTPLRALAPQRGRLTFEPREAARETTETGIATWFREDRREVIVRYKAVTPQSRNQAPAAASRP
ncbi:MAG: hypothetical protein AAB433_23390 [Nitrospirota bacterium]